jgi:hypothetical protein
MAMVAASLHELLAEPGQTDALGAAALDRVLGEFDWNRVADKTSRLQETI